MAYFKRTIPQWIISTSSDGDLACLNVSKNQEIFRMTEIHDSDVVTLAGSSRGKYFLLATQQGSVLLIDLEVQQILKEFVSVHDGLIPCAAISENERFAVTGGADMSVVFYNLKTLRIDHKLPNIHASQKSLLIGSCLFNILLSDTIFALTISSDSSKLVTASSDASIKIINIISKTVLYHIYLVDKKPTDEFIGDIFTISMGGKRDLVIAGTFDRKVAILDTSKGKIERVFENQHDASITTSAVAMTSNIAVTGSCDGKINVYDMKAKKALGKINDLHDSKIDSVKLSPNGRFMYTLSRNGNVQLIDVIKRKVITVFEEVHVSLPSSEDILCHVGSLSIF